MKVQPTTRQLIEMLYERLPELFDRVAPPALPAAPVQEPVATVKESLQVEQLLNDMLDTLPYNSPEYWMGRIKEVLPINTTPPAAQPAVPLTPEQVRDLCKSAGYGMTSMQARADFINGIRHGEAAHGITEKGQP